MFRKKFKYPLELIFLFYDVEKSLSCKKKFIAVSVVSSLSRILFFTKTSLLSFVSKLRPVTINTKSLAVLVSPVNVTSKDPRWWVIHPVTPRIRKRKNCQRSLCNYDD